MRRLLFSAFLFPFFSFIFCDSPVDPFNSPANSGADITIVNSSGENGSTVADSTGKTLVLEITPLIPEFLDSLAIKITRNSLPETTIIISESKQLKSKIEISLEFKDAGERGVEMIVFRDGAPDLRKTATILILGNQPPEISISGLEEKSDTLKAKEGEELLVEVEVLRPDSSDIVSVKILCPDNIYGCEFDSDSLERRFTWTPSFDFTDGSKKLTIGPLLCIACNDDEEPLCDSFPFFISVSDSNAAPLWNKTRVFLEGKELDTLRYSLSDVFKGDPDGDKVTFGASIGKINKSDSSWIWVPGINDNGSVICSVYVIDSHDPPDSSLLQIIISVADTRLPPEISIRGLEEKRDTLEAKEGEELLVEVEVQNPDSSDFASVKILCPDNIDGCEFDYDSLERRFIWTPSFDFTGGSKKLTIGPLFCIACNGDEKPLCDSFPFFITVRDSNAAPLWKKSKVTIEGKELDTLRYSLSSVFKGDPDGDDVTFRASMGKINKSDSSWFWVPGINDNGSVICSVYVIDSHDPPDSSLLQIVISVADSNLPPAFISLPESLLISEGTERKIALLAEDPEGEKPKISIKAPDPQPAWIDLVEEDGKSYLVFDPDYSVVKQNSTLNLVLLLSLTDSINTVESAISIEVRNTNRKPSLKDLPSEALQTGRSGWFTVHTEDPDSDSVTVKLINSPKGISYDGKSKKLSWFIDRSRFTEGDILDILLRVSDGEDSVEYRCRPEISAHVWEYRCDGLNKVNDLVTALDSTVVYYMYQYGGVVMYRSEDGGKTFPANPEFKFGESFYNPSIAVPLANGRIYLCGNYKGWSYSTAYDTNIKDTINFFEEGMTISSYVVDPINEGVYFGGFRGKYQLFYDGDLMRLIPCISFDCDTAKGKYGPVVRDLEVAGRGIIFAATDSGCYRKSPSSSYYWERVSSMRFGFEIESDKDNGDTLYMIDSTAGINGLYMCTNGLEKSISLTRVQLPVIPNRIFMLDSRCGWIIDPSGTVYFTNDCFTRCNKEVFKDRNGNELPIREIIVAADKKSVYAVSENGTLFGY